MVFKSKPAKQEDRNGSQNVAMTFISQGSKVTGDIFASGNLRVDGTIHGNVRADGNLEVSASGVIEGKTVSARNIVIHGLVKATMSAEEQLRIHNQGEVQGDVTAQSLDIESGAKFVGYSHTGVKQSAEILAIDQSANQVKKDK
jgi:cytoskeletal protein CcmA (bactofilin family)